jgi:lipopolysaccharide export system permease protein
MRIPPTLSTYIGRQFLAAFASVLLVIMGIILLFDVIELIRRAAGREGVGFGLIMGMALLKLPQMVHTILPFAVMIGSMVAFWRLTRSHELVIARATGVSAWEFLAPAVIAVFAIGVFEVTAFNPLAAAMYSRYEHIQDSTINRRNNGSLDLSETGLWLREPLDQGEVVVHAEDVRQEAFTLHLRDVHIFIYDRPDHFLRRIQAPKATLLDGAFEMPTARIMEPGRPTVAITDYVLPTQLTLDRIHDNFASPEAMSFWELPAFIGFFEKAGFAANKHRLYLQSLLSSPFLYSGMVLVAALFSLKPNMRSGGLMGRMASGVATGFVVYFFSRLVYAFGLSSALPLTLAAWAPATVAALVGTAGLFHMEDG